jgi:hypothetical protein
MESMLITGLQFLLIEILASRQISTMEAIREVKDE